jgi:hypothetical protein
MFDFLSDFMKRIKWRRTGEEREQQTRVRTAGNGEAVFYSLGI